MRRARCRHCGQLGATNRWYLKACADGRKRTALLCGKCDTKANAWALRFFRVAEAEQKLEAYRP